MNKSHLIRNIVAAELVLLIPLIAMFFSEEVDWKLPDFIVVGLLLAGVGLGMHLILEGIKSNSRQVLVGIGLAAATILIWIELAVGIFD